MKRILQYVLGLFLVLFAVSCGSNAKEETTTESKTLKLAVLSAGYGEELWPKIVEEYNKINPNVKVELLQSKTLEEELTSKIKGGDYPDVVMLAMGRKAALTENFVNEQALADLSDVLEMKVPGEDVTVGSKIIDGFTGNTVTNPYGDNKVYLMPVLYSPTGLFYNKTLFESKNWQLPTTWDELFALGEQAKKDNISLFTYPVSGYLDSFLPAVFGTVGGYDAIKGYFGFEKGFYNSESATKFFDIMSKVFANVDKSTVANATSNYKKNQQMIIDGNALFMPNGTWVVGEMAETTPDTMKWGMMSYPKYSENGDRYAFSFFEQIWVPEKAENKDVAKDFIAFIYSDAAAKIFANYQAVQPIKSFPYEALSEENQVFYNVYKEGAKAIVGGFKAFNPIEGLNLKAEYFGTIDSVVNKSMSIDQWKEILSKTNDKISDNLIK